MDTENKKSDQWLLDGDCSLCRKRNYCTKNCSKRIERLNRIGGSAISSIILKRLFGGK